MNKMRTHAHNVVTSAEKPFEARRESKRGPRSGGETNVYEEVTWMRLWLVRPDRYGGGTTPLMQATSLHDRASCAPLFRAEVHVRGTLVRCAMPDVVVVGTARPGHPPVIHSETMGGSSDAY